MKQLMTALLLATSAAGIAAQPRAEFVQTTYDFGAFDENDGTVECRFRFVNTGNEPLAIVNARATCGCTTPSYTTETIAPGDTGSIAVTYNPTGRPGRFSKKVYVDFNTEPPRHTLMIKGVVIGSSNTLRGRYPIDAGELKLRSGVIMFGDVKNGRSKSAFFEVYNATADTLMPQWTHLPEGVQTTTVTPKIAPGEQGTYTMYFLAKGDELYGILQDSLLLRATPYSEPIKVDMTAIIEEDFTTMTPQQRRDAPHVLISTPLIDFETINRSDGPATRSLTLRNTGKSPLLLRRVYTVDPAITLNIPTRKLKPGKEMQIGVTIDPSAVNGDILNARINVIVNDPDQPGSAVRCVAEIH